MWCSDDSDVFVLYDNKGSKVIIGPFRDDEVDDEDDDDEDDEVISLKKKLNINHSYFFSYTRLGTLSSFRLVLYFFFIRPLPLLFPSFLIFF